jgi:hypothetical protein
VNIHITGNFSDPGAFMENHSLTVYLEINAAHDGEGHPAVLVPSETNFSLGMHTPGEYTVVIIGISCGVFVGYSIKFNFVVESEERQMESMNLKIPPSKFSQILWRIF